VRRYLEPGYSFLQAALGRASAFTAVVLLGCGREAPDRANEIQVPLILLVLATPALAFALRERSRRTRVATLILQLVLYAVYESGVSNQTNIRVDLLLIYPALLLTAAITLRPSSGAAATDR